MKCSNHIGYGKDGDPDKWGATVCGMETGCICHKCKKPACVYHTDSGKDRLKCMDCYEAENEAYKASQGIKALQAVSARKSRLASRN